ncbi:MAG: DUF1015 domain-containing protein [Oscillospiraceae bacterium]|nr:DUF1015 domain-containing protein [Oscillospiraceae bacterium]MDD4414551.1 DUF1015 domain-containing protein [Oscillospiraceae bacterium]
MAEIRPFRALRFTPKAGKAEELTCPPYDIIDEEQRRAFLAQNPYNIIRLELPKDGNEPYKQAGKVLEGWLNDGILRQDDTPALYVYEIRFTLERDGNISGTEGETRSIMGLVGLVKLEEFEKGIVLPHEETLSKAKTDRFNLMQATNCNFSCIYSLYMDDDGKGEMPDIPSLISNMQPISRMTDENRLEHRLWAITDPEIIACVQRNMADTRLYIADGHHRYETALNYRNALRSKGAPQGAPSDYVMMMMVEMNHPGLVVFPTHRLVRGLDNFDAAALIKASAPYFDMDEGVEVAALNETLENAYKGGRHAFGFYTGGDSFTLMTLRDSAVMDELLPSLSGASRSLDVTILHTLVLERLMGIDRENMANQRNLTYTRSLCDVLGGVDKGEFQCGFILNPTRVSEIRDVASAGEKMPQKSTYFYPKLITGLTMNKLD